MANLKDVWKVELDILKQIIKICEKYGIKYSMAGGSMLGAVRHDGIIPWDDDIDISMLRDDYEKFIKIAKKELKKPYFLVTSETDRRFLPHAQVQNLDTYAKINEIDCKMGIFVDIFSFDKVPESKFRRKIHELRLKLKNKYLSVYYHTDEKAKSFPAQLYREYVKLTKKFGADFDKKYKSYKKLAMKYNNSDSKKVSTPEFLACYEKDLADTEDYEDLIEHKFENMTVKIPRNYDKILTTHYGDYMKPVKGTQLHTIEGYDTKNSYIKYI